MSMNDSDKDTIKLSQSEAKVIVSALARQETIASGSDEETIITIRERFEETFNLGDERTNQNGSDEDTIPGATD
jgi:molybdopterin-guanine dinucleotide biosynthesis protein